VIYLFSSQYIRSKQEEKLQITFDQGDYDMVMSDSIENITTLSNKFFQDGIFGFCIKGSNQYLVNGNDYDLKNDQYFKSHAMGGYYKKFDELLTSDHLSRESFYYYKDFLDKHLFIRCIKPDVNLKANKNSLPLYAIMFTLSDHSGYIFVSDGSVSENVYDKYRDKTFDQLDRIKNSKLFKYKLKE
jgi:hypothetical protein